MCDKANIKWACRAAIDPPEPVPWLQIGIALFFIAIALNTLCFWSYECVRVQGFKAKQQKLRRSQKKDLAEVRKFCLDDPMGKAAAVRTVFAHPPS